MGETYGSVWTSIVYMVLVFTFLTFIVMSITIIDFWSGQRKLEDGYREGDLAVVETLSHRFHPCEGGIATENTETGNYLQCTGYRGENSTTGEVYYQIFFHGKGMNIDTTDNSYEDSNVVNLSY
ncbi:MAG: hypothetical protein ACK5HR_05595 [Mycoplasmatales bacterium]